MHGKDHLTDSELILPAYIKRTNVSSDCMSVTSEIGETSSKAATRGKIF